ncbi:MAG: hypothetical protein HC801_02670 [Nitrospira sp.]|nr:hypothetical protein [Nitrospira sp.]
MGSSNRVGVGSIEDLSGDKSWAVGTIGGGASGCIDRLAPAADGEVTFGGAGMGGGCACTLSIEFSSAQGAGWTAGVDVGAGRGRGGVAVIGGVAGSAG